jgi:hypothetical protein
MLDDEGYFEKYKLVLVSGSDNVGWWVSAKCFVKLDKYREMKLDCIL